MPFTQSNKSHESRISLSQKILVNLSTNYFSYILWSGSFVHCKQLLNHPQPKETILTSLLVISNMIITTLIYMTPSPKLSLELLSVVLTKWLLSVDLDYPWLWIVMMTPMKLEPVIKLRDREPNLLQVVWNRLWLIMIFKEGELK